MLDDKLLLNQDISRAGIYPDGSIPKSVTKAITMELEKARSIQLGVTIAENMERDQYERWAFEACGKLSGVFLLSPPDQFGYMEDPVYQVALSTLTMPSHGASSGTLLWEQWPTVR